MPDDTPDMTVVYHPSSEAAGLGGCNLCHRSWRERGIWLIHSGLNGRPYIRLCPVCMTGVIDKVKGPDEPTWDDDPFKGAETSRCKHCNRPMPGAHPNKKFCSNKGRGNCKDTYHNRTNPRGQALDRDDDDTHGHPYEGGFWGHGQE